MLLTACTPTVFTKWGHPTKAEDRFELDSHICETLAVKHTTLKIPNYKDANLIVTMDGTMEDAIATDYLRCIDAGGWKIRYQIVGTFRSEEQMDDDLKKCGYMKDTVGCMVGVGWTVVNHSPWFKTNHILDQECNVPHTH